MSVVRGIRSKYVFLVGDDEETQLEKCKRCINVEYREFTDDTKDYFCHEANTKIENIHFNESCQCFEEAE